MKTFIIGFFAIVALSACSKGGGGAAAPSIPGAGLPELTDTQSSRLDQFSQEVVDVNGATSKHITMDKKKLGRVMAMTGAKKQPQRPKYSKNWGDYSDDMDKMFNNSCELEVEGLDTIPDDFMPGGINTNSIEIPTINAKVNVVTNKMSMNPCPIDGSMNLSMSGVSKQTSNSADVAMDLAFSQKFKVNDPNDTRMEIVGIEQGFNAKIKVAGNQNGFGMTLVGSGVGIYESREDFEGTVKTSVQATFKMSMTEQSSTMKGLVAMAYEFNDFKAVGAVKFSGRLDGESEPVVKYYLNGRETDEETFLHYFGNTLESSMGGIEATGFMQ